MNSLQAFAMGQAHSHCELMVFDWIKAAELIKIKQVKIASAGLANDWEYTGGVIYRDGQIVKDEYTYLASTWAEPELDLDGEIIECFKMASEVPNWDDHTKWPEEAIQTLNK